MVRVHIEVYDDKLYHWPLIEECYGMMHSIPRIGEEVQVGKFKMKVMNVIHPLIHTGDNEYKNTVLKVLKRY